MKIYKQDGTLFFEVAVDDESYRYRAIMGDDNVTLKYSAPVPTDIPIGSYIEYEGSKYTLLRREQLKMVHTRDYEYTATFESAIARAQTWMFRNPVDGRLSFPLTAKPSEHLQMVVDNLNMRDSGWSVGDCIEGVEHLISYDHDNVLDALKRIADELDTEYEVVGKARRGYESWDILERRYKIKLHKHGKRRYRKAALAA